METFEYKRNLLLEMIAFSIVDGQLHKREYDFLLIVAQELQIEKEVLDDLFHQELPHKVIKSEFERIQQFYRLALLMHADGVLHLKEENAIQQIAINMGLNPISIKKVIALMKTKPEPTIDPKVLIGIFYEQYN